MKLFTKKSFDLGLDGWSGQQRKMESHWRLNFKIWPLFGGLLDLSAFWKALLVILEKTLMIEIWWEGGGNQDYLREEEARWTSSPPGPNDCVVIRRLVAVITDY